MPSLRPSPRPLTTTTLSVAPSAVAEGQSATLSATVTAATGPTPSGSVSFFYNHTLLASAKLNDAGSASVSLSSANVPPGAYSIDAKYSGNSSDAASTSAPVSATVLADTTTTLSSPTSSYVLGQPATLTAHITSKSGNPAGTVAFYYGNLLLGSATLKSGSASITETIPVSYQPGTYNVVAKYSGTSYYAPSSGSFTLSLNFAIAPASAALRPSATRQFSLSPVPSAAVTWYVNGIAGGNSSLGTISPSGLYTAPAVTSALSNSITASVAADPHYTTPAAPLYVVPAGVLASTSNGQVASYTVSLPAGAAVSAQFGTTTSYGLNTWSVPAPSAGGSTQLLIAGMLENTIYHIQATISLPGGLSLTDPDHPFTTTQSLPSFPTIKATPTSYTPQPGVEFLDRENTGAYITDLDGNYLWGYPLVNTTSDDYLHPFKLLADGNLLIELGPDSSNALNGIAPPTGTAFEVREVDYTNTIVRDLSMATLQANLNASGYLNNEGNQITLSDIHHDVTVNSTTGHWILIANIFKYFTGLTGYPKESPPSATSSSTLIPTTTSPLTGSGTSSTTSTSTASPWASPTGPTPTPSSTRPTITTSWSPSATRTGSSNSTTTTLPVTGPSSGTSAIRVTSPSPMAPVPRIGSTPSTNPPSPRRIPPASSASSSWTTATTAPSPPDSPAPSPSLRTPASTPALPSSPSMKTP